MCDRDFLFRISRLPKIVGVSVQRYSETSHPTSLRRHAIQKYYATSGALSSARLICFRAGPDELFLYLQFLGREPAFSHRHSRHAANCPAACHCPVTFTRISPGAFSRSPPRPFRWLSLATSRRVGYSARPTLLALPSVARAFSVDSAAYFLLNSGALRRNVVLSASSRIFRHRSLRKQRGTAPNTRGNHFHRFRLPSGLRAHSAVAASSPRVVPPLRLRAPQTSIP